MTTPSATNSSGGKSARVGRAWRVISNAHRASKAAIAALTAVRNSGSSSSTATRVAGSEPLKIIMPRKPFIQP